jgi:hypothetical protein
LLVAGCGGDDNAANTGGPSTEATSTEVTSTDVAASDIVSTTAPIETGLPAGCELPPISITAARVGAAPIGSDAFAVTDAVVIPIPFVPNPGSAMTDAQIAELAATTELLGYSLVFADEPIVGGGSDFFQYEPVTAGKLRGLVSIFPPAGVPLVAGDVVAYGVVPGLSIPLPTIGIDLAAFEQPTNSYAGPPAGQVTVLGITADALCLDIDLTFSLNNPAGNTLTIRGVVAARLLDRSTLVRMS